MAPLPDRTLSASRSRAIRSLAAGHGQATLSSCPKPSRDDIEMTREIKTSAEALGISIHDHLVIDRKGNARLRSLGLLS